MTLLLRAIVAAEDAGVAADLGLVAVPATRRRRARVTVGGGRRRG